MPNQVLYVNNAGTHHICKDLGMNDAGTFHRLAAMFDGKFHSYKAGPESVFPLTNKGLELAFDLALERKIAEAKEDPACEVLEDLLTAQMMAA